jgi:DNA-binding XRE family transcriptional regulator
MRPLPQIKKANSPSINKSPEDYVSIHNFYLCSLLLTLSPLLPIIILIMRTTETPLLPTQRKTLEAAGQNIRYARLRRNLSMEMVAERAGISRATLGKIEKGDGGVASGAWVKVLFVLSLEADFASLAKDDDFGRQLQDARLPSRVRATRSSVSHL